MRRLSTRAAHATLVAVSLCVAVAGCNSATARSARHRDPAPVSTIDDRQTLGFLASDELEGRGIGTLGLDRAAGYIAGQFTQMGLQPLPGERDFFQPFEVTTATEIGPGTTLRAGDRAFAKGDDFAPIAQTGDGSFDGPVVFVGYGIKSDEHHYDDYAGLDVKGKIALAMRFEPHDAKGKSRFADDGWSDAAPVAQKAKLARENGAVALLLVTPAGFHADEDRFLPLAAAGPTNPSSQIPIIQVKRTVADELLRRGGASDLAALQKQIDDSVKRASFALPDVRASGRVELERTRVTVKNVIGYVPGKKQDEYIVLGAHYDHLGRGGLGSLSPRSREIHNGADDNASGTTAMLMLAARFAAGPTPDRSIIFAAFTGEEEGLLGSARFVEHSPVPLKQIVGMINLDMVGRVRTPTQMAAASTHGATAPTTQDDSPILYVGGAGTAGAFDAIVKDADARSPLQVKDIGRGGIGPSDHMSFALKKIPVLFLFSGLHADYHRPTDDADKINYRGIEQVVDFTADLLRGMADMPRQQYVDAADASPMRFGLGHGDGPSGSGARVTLGVVPDYSSFGQGGGVRISGTSPGSPAAEAGLRAGDVIVKMGERDIDTLYDLSDVLAKGKPGQKVKLKVLRDGGKTPVELEATLAERKG
jgi:hypothetical protein